MAISFSRQHPESSSDPFRVVRRGFDPDEVRAYIAQFSAEVQQLRDQLAAVESALADAQRPTYDLNDLTPEVLLDLVLIAACYYFAFRLRFEGESLDHFLPYFTASLPVVLACKLAALYGSGLYQRSWSTFGLRDVTASQRLVIPLINEPAAPIRPTAPAGPASVSAATMVASSDLPVSVSTPRR